MGFRDIVKLYWSPIFIVVYPLLLLPIFILSFAKPMRCTYVIAVMLGYYVTQVLPYPIVGLVPIVFFPMFGIMDTSKTSLCYMSEFSMLFIAGTVISVAIEQCKLGRRIALYFVKWSSSKPLNLSILFCSFTFITTMFISNVMTVLIFSPILEFALEELERQGVMKFFNDSVPSIERKSLDGIKDFTVTRIPTKMTVGFFLGLAYFANIGGSVSLSGSYANEVFYAVFNKHYPNNTGIVNFENWMATSFPISLILLILTWFWLQTLYMSMFKVHRQVRSSSLEVEYKGLRSSILKDRINNLGRMDYEEYCVVICLIVAVLLWITRNPKYFPGWATFFSVKIGDECVAALIAVVIFMIPKQYDFIYCFSKNVEKRPKETSSGLLAWKIVKEKCPWGIIFSIGGGVALAEGMMVTGLMDLIINYIDKLFNFKYATMVMVCVVATVFTEIALNTSIIAVILPPLVKKCQEKQIHPLYLMLPVTQACSHSFCLFMSTISNALVTYRVNISMAVMAKTGIFIKLVALLILVVVFPFLGKAFFNLDEFPDWAKNNTIK